MYKKKSLLNVSFKESRNVVTDEFIKSDVLKSYRYPNKVNKTFGILMLPITGILIMLGFYLNKTHLYFFSFDFSEEISHIVWLIFMLSLFLLIIILIILMLICWRATPLFISIFNLSFVFEMFLLIIFGTVYCSAL